MGTRGSFGFRIKTKDKLAYNHFDSYPDGLGASVCDFMMTEARTPPSL